MRIGSYVLAIFAMTLNLGCDNKAYRPYSMKVGEIVHVPGMSLSRYQNQKRPLRKNVLLLLNKGGMHLDVNEDFSIEMFKENPTSNKIPSKMYSSSDLRRMHEQTHCTVELKNYLIAQEGSGYVLFCNGTFDVEEFSYFQLTYEGKTKEATSITIFFSSPEDELVGGSLFFQ